MKSGGKTEREQVWNEIRKCRRCPLHRAGNGPVPFTGPTPSDIVVIGEAPGSQEDKALEPFVGPAGKKLWDALQKFGIGKDECFVCNSVSCFPRRTPNKEEIEACRVNVAEQMVIADPSYVLVLGAVALSIFKPWERISSFRGGTWQRSTHSGKTRKYLCTYHPAAILYNQKLERVWLDDLARFAEMVT